MKIGEAQQEITTALSQVYPAGETAAIANLVMENVTGLTKLDRVFHKNDLMRPEDAAKIASCVKELLTGKPVQYVLHEAWFCDFKFYVDETVLIPRPETEELLNRVVKDLLQAKGDGCQHAQKNTENSPSAWRIIDIGTGSGCLAVALKLKIKTLEISACDISEDALQVAERNAEFHGADVRFFKRNILDNPAKRVGAAYDIIITNPPYIPSEEMPSLPLQITAFEPHIALFTPPGDALIFYRAIADFALHNLLPKGKVYAEIHEDKSSHVKKLFLDRGFAPVIVCRDIFGKERLLIATLLP